MSYDFGKEWKNFAHSVSNANCDQTSVHNPKEMEELENLWRN